MGNKVQNIGNTIIYTLKYTCLYKQKQLFLKSKTTVFIRCGLMHITVY